MLWSMALSGKTTQLIQRKYSSFVKVACDRSIRLHYECRTLRQPTHSHEAQSVSVVRDFHWDSRVFSVTTEMLQINYYKVWISCVAWYRTADRGISWKISTDSLFLFPRFFALCHQNSKETFVASRKKTRKSEMEKSCFLCVQPFSLWNFKKRLLRPPRLRLPLQLHRFWFMDARLSRTVQHLFGAIIRLIVKIWRKK